MKDNHHLLNRRQLLNKAALLALATTTPLHALSPETHAIITRSIPSSGESLPAIGMGSYQTFDVYNDDKQLLNLKKVLAAFFKYHGRLVDSSPMYGQSESRIGELMATLPGHTPMFAATKVWTHGKDEGIAQMQCSFKRMGVKQMDLMQIHNLKDWKTHIKTLREWKEQGKIRYLGITTSFLPQYDDFEAVMRAEPLDFVQLNYNIQVREAEKRLLPLALDNNMAVIINKPYEKGQLFRKVKGQSLPQWAKEFDCHSWGQFFLKFIVSHPAVTCAIPATSKVKHMLDNMGACRGKLPDQKTRQRMQQWFAKL